MINGIKAPSGYFALNLYVITPRYGKKIKRDTIILTSKLRKLHDQRNEGTLGIFCTKLVRNNLRK